MYPFTLPLTHPENRHLVQIQARLGVFVQAAPPYFEYTQTGSFARTTLDATGRLLLALAEQQESFPRDLAYAHFVRYTWRLAEAQLLASYVWLAQCRSMYGWQEWQYPQIPETSVPPRYTYSDLFSHPTPDARSYLDTNIRISAYDTKRRVATLDISAELRSEVENLPLSVIVSWSDFLEASGSLPLKCAYVLYLKSAQFHRHCERVALQPALAYRHWCTWDG